MDGEELLKLFEQNWSQRSIFKKVKDILGVGEELGESEEEEEEAVKNIPASFLVERAMSDETMMTTTSSKTSLCGSNLSDDLFLSPRSVLTVKSSSPMKLQTILSGKEVTSKVKTEEEEEEKQRRKIKKSSNVRTRRGKSMSGLEYEELKGFMDLGFVFSEEDHKDTDLVSILPGLQRLVKKDEETEEEEEDGNRSVARPYLSEVWDHNCGGKKGKKMITPEIKWRVPAPVTNEVDLKDHLKLWAHAVASTIR